MSLTWSWGQNRQKACFSVLCFSTCRPPIPQPQWLEPQQPFCIMRWLWGPLSCPEDGEDQMAGVWVPEAIEELHATLSQSPSDFLT